jgi:NADPH:quinone reductase
MRAIRVHEAGPPEVMRLEEIDSPRPKPGEAIVHVEAAGVNFIDIYKRSGQYKIPLPSTLGEEGAGTVSAIGEGVTDVAVGDRVAWSGALGAYAELAAVPAWRLVQLPNDVSVMQGAAIMLQGITAHYLACSTYPVSKDTTCLLHAGAGGVGLLLTQIAKRRGARVIVTVGSDEKAELAKDAGADEIIIYTRQDFVAETKRLTDGRGVDVVYDSVGKTTFLGGLDVLVPRGMMVLFGQSSGAVAPIDPQILNQKGSLFLTRPTIVHYTRTKEELQERAKNLFEWIANDGLRVRIGAEYPLAEAGEAHRALEGRRTTGKVILRIAS